MNGIRWAFDEHAAKQQQEADSENLRQQDEDAERAWTPAPQTPEQVAAGLRQAFKASVAEDLSVTAVAPEPAPAPTDEELLELCWRDNTLLSEDLRCAYDLGREHGAAAARCPHIRSSDEGTSYCALAEKTAATQAFWFVAFAPAGELVERVADAIYRNGIGDGFREEARAAIREVAKWLREAHGWEEGAQGLEREVNQ